MSLHEPRARHQTKAFIHLDHLTHNVRLLQTQVGNVRLWPVMKANAYGHDAVMVGAHLVRLGYNNFCVADIDEAIALAEAGVRATYIVLSATLPLIATIPIGYGDGLNRNLSNNMEVLVRGRRCPQVGRITMDMSLIDVTTLRGHVELGDEVIIIGQQGEEEITADELAIKLGTINYEIVTCISHRVPRVVHYLSAATPS